MPHHQNLVDQFGRLPRANRSKVRDGCPHCLENRQRPLKLGDIAADHNAEGPARRALRSTAHRRIEHMNVTFCQVRRDPLCRPRADRAHVDHQRTGACAVNDAAFAEEHLFDIGSIADAGDDDVAVECQIAGTAGGSCPFRRQFVHAAGGAVPYPQRKPCLQDIARHAAPHDAETDESNTFTLIHTPVSPHISVRNHWRSLYHARLRHLPCLRNGCVICGDCPHTDERLQ
jgi:hypothetical protein